MAPGRAPTRHPARRSTTHQRRRARRWLWALSVVLLVIGGAGYLAWNYGLAGLPEVGDRAPAFVLEDSAGRPVNVGDHLGRQPVLLAFYMTYG